MENIYGTTFVALGVGIIVGLIFGLLKLPYPAPSVLPGVMAVVGVYLGGGVLAPKLLELFNKFF